jgi:hypothetical protein
MEGTVPSPLNDLKVSMALRLEGTESESTLPMKRNVGAEQEQSEARACSSQLGNKSSHSLEKKVQSMRFRVG